MNLDTTLDRNPEGVIKQLRKLAKRDLRICQIMWNVFYQIKKDGKDPFFIENEELEKRLLGLLNS